MEVVLGPREKVKSEISRLRTQGSLVPSSQTKTILFQNVGSLHIHIDDVQSDYNIQKADANIFENFACEKEMMHISFVNLQVTEITIVS